MDKLITVIIPVRNGEAFIEKAIESVLSQSANSFKIIISDNGSTDLTAQIVSKYAQDHSCRNRLFRSDKPNGCRV